MGLILALFMHLRWHPLRECFSRATSLLQAMPWLVLTFVALMLVPASLEPWTIPGKADGWMGLTLKEQLVHVLPMAGLDLATMLHGLLPPWPMALTAPLLLSWIFLQLKKAQRLTRSERQAQRIWERCLVIGGVAFVAWLWLTVEGLRMLGTLPAWADSGRWFLRWVMEASLMALTQLFLIHWIIIQEEDSGFPRRRDALQALDRILIQWRGCLLLVVLDGFWLIAWSHLGDQAFGLMEALILEAAILFAVLPVVVARIQDSFAGILAQSMQALFLAGLPLLGGGLTALAILVLGHFSVQNFLNLAGESLFWNWSARIFGALVLATLQSWLFLALVLTLLRHGLKAAALRESVN